MKVIRNCLQAAALLLVALALSALSTCAMAEGASTATGEAQLDEWTVMFYFCGSDLESKYGYATGNLEEIYSTSRTISLIPQFFEGSEIESTLSANTPGQVNVLLETGGAKAWHSQSRFMRIDQGVLQRWRYRNGESEQEPEKPIGFELLQSLPLQSMSAPETLSDFIRWGTETCPAKKYALVLWGHGSGGGSGIFIDELFDGDIMYLYELKQALADGGAHFETIILDACLMANLETAWAVKDAANWMVASEENVPGKGTAIGQWLQELTDNPLCDGYWLGRCVCDTTVIKYANDADKLSRSFLTWSVIELSKIDQLVETTKRLIASFADVLRYSPQHMNIYVQFLNDAVEYGDGTQDMRELSSVVYHPLSSLFMDYDLRNDMLQALAEAVDYSLRGNGRSGARGLSFCYPVDFDDDELDIYAKNCPMPEYMAFLDAIKSWKAPDWVYEHVERLPEIDTIEEFEINFSKAVDRDGMPALAIDYDNSNLTIGEIDYCLYRLDERTGRTLRLGRTICTRNHSDESNALCRATDPMHWPTIDGTLICMDLLQSNNDLRLYNVPAQINSQSAILRCGRTVTQDPDTGKITSDYEIYGVWEGYEEDSRLPGRSVQPLAMVVGQEYRLLYPMESKGKLGRASYQASEPKTMYLKLMVEEQPLPPGTYYIEYIVTDVFKRSFPLDRFEVHWDGENMTCPNLDAWTGEVTLN